MADSEGVFALKTLHTPSSFTDEYDEKLLQDGSGASPVAGLRKQPFVRGNMPAFLHFFWQVLNQRTSLAGTNSWSFGSSVPALRSGHVAELGCAIRRVLEPFFVARFWRQGHKLRCPYSSFERLSPSLSQTSAGEGTRNFKLHTSCLEQDL